MDKLIRRQVCNFPAAWSDRVFAVGFYLQLGWFNENGLLTTIISIIVDHWSFRINVALSHICHRSLRISDALQLVCSSAI